jgi:hypothetical protein
MLVGDRTATVLLFVVCAKAQFKAARVVEVPRHSVARGGSEECANALMAAVVTAPSLQLTHSTYSTLGRAACACAEAYAVDA